ncbi:MAG: hypothetical protein Kow0098_15540 [Ignavibacteriaceae bacterium]
MKETEKKNVLIIDDDVTVRKLLNFHLRKKGYQVYEATGPKDGFTCLHENPVDLVLCDVTMDEMDGFTFCREVRRSEKYKLLPFVFVTAKNSIEDKSKALEAGGDDLISKPFDIEEIDLKIKTLLRRTEIFRKYDNRFTLKESGVQDSQPYILLVDDDPTLAKLFQFNLQKEGMEVQLALSAEEAISSINTKKPDIIISDIMMPKTDGFAFRKQLLEKEELKSIPFIFLTAKESESDILDGYDLDITEYVLKTAGPKVVAAKVKAIIKSLFKERNKVYSELSSVSESMRAKIVPETFPEFPGFDIRHWHKPFEGIPGGDFIDYFRIDENNIAVILGDVMGKRWGAWYFAYAYAGYIRSALRSALQITDNYSPSSVLEQVNRSVYNDSKISEVFTTLSVVFLNNKSMELSYSGAGDLPVIVFNKSTQKTEKLVSSGLLLGFSKEGDYKNVSYRLRNDDIVFLFTDGVIEARNQNGALLGTAGVEDALVRIDGSMDAGNFLFNEIQNFTGGKFDDDISLITITPV